MSREDLAAWKAEAAKQAKAKRTQRGRRQSTDRSVWTYRPGMGRLATVRTKQDGDQSNDGTWHD